jgi:RNA polymerase sigma-70 factor (ECF subfamily)
MTDSGALFAVHHQRLLAYFRRAVGDHEMARDLAQEVFLRASRSRVPAAEAEARAWLFRVARNLALDHHRHRRRHPESPVPQDEAARPATQDVELAVNEALDLLPDVDRDVFLMREVAGLGYDEIAQVCDLTPDAVRSRLYRTRMQLREQLARPIAAWRTTATRRASLPT